MIKLETYKRCENCPYFNAETISQSLYGDFQRLLTEYQVVCQHRELCNHLLQYLQEGLRKGTIREE